jgi:hypothetical protein
LSILNSVVTLKYENGTVFTVPLDFYRTTMIKDISFWMNP